MKAPVIEKRWAYIVTESTHKSAKRGETLFFKKNHGVRHSMNMVNKETLDCTGSIFLSRLAQCWVVDGKIQFEEPPEKPGILTKRMLGKKH